MTRLITNETKQIVPLTGVEAVGPPTEPMEADLGPALILLDEARENALVFDTHVPTVSEDAAQGSGPTGFYYRPSDGGSCRTELPIRICLQFEDGYRWLVPISEIGLCSWSHETVDGYSVTIGNMCDGRRFAHAIGTSYVKEPY